MTGAMHISQEDLILYAMRTLDPAEESRVRAHIEGCEPCRDVLAEITGDLGLLALGVEQHEVPKEARDKFLASIGAASASTSRVVNIAEHLPSAQQSATRGGTMQKISWAAIAALVLVTLGLGVKLHLVTQELDRQSALVSAQSAASARAQRVLELLTAPASSHVLLTAGTTHPNPSARAVYSASGGALILEASNLAPVAADKTYELWIIPTNGGVPIPAGLFRPDAAGDAHLVLPQIPAGIEAKALGVTVEQASGAATPTLPIVLAGQLPPQAE